MADPLLKVDSGGDPVLMDIVNRLVDHVRALEFQLASLRISGGIAGCYVAVVQTGGIAAAVDDDHPGVGNVMLRILSGDGILRDSNIIVPCFNIAKGADGGVVAGKQIQCKALQNKPGFLMVDVDPCPPT
jgi:hypothetical protein